MEGERQSGDTIAVGDEAALRAVLQTAGVPYDTWGQGVAKTTEHLLDEVRSGETRLSWGPDGELVRTVSVVWVDVFGHDNQGRRWHLREDRQVFRDGRERRRQLQTSLGEKMLPDEDIIAATQRALVEELGVVGTSAVEYLGSEQTVHTPISYPGLESRYDTHVVRIEITSDQFRADGYVEHQADKSTFFVWEPADPTVTDRAML